MTSFQTFDDSRCIVHFGDILIRGLAAGRRNTVVLVSMVGRKKRQRKGPQLEERMRTVLLLVSLAAMRLASGGISPALLRFTMVVKEISEY